MKKLLTMMCVLMFLGFAVSAQETSANGETQAWKENPRSLGAGIEYGMHTRENYAPGYAVSLDRYLFTPLLALGLRGTMYNDSVSVTGSEVLINLRAYAPLTDNASLFAQWGFGAAFYNEEDRQKNTYAMDLLAGSRIYITRSVLRGFYIEPFIRTGFPFNFSGGLAIGHWFNF